MLNLNSRGGWNMMDGNFKWLTGDIDSSLILKVIYKKNKDTTNFK